MSAQSKSSTSRFAEKMARIKIPGLRRSRTSMISDDNSDESSSLKTSSSTSVPEENSVGYPSTTSSSSLNALGSPSPISRPTSELIAPSHLANLVAPLISTSSPVAVLTISKKREVLVSRSNHHQLLFLHSPHAFFQFRKINGSTRASSWSLDRLDWLSVLATG